MCSNLPATCVQTKFNLYTVLIVIAGKKITYQRLAVDKVYLGINAESHRVAPLVNYFVHEIKSKLIQMSRCLTASFLVALKHFQTELPSA